jgi:hypothetical protein
MDDIAHALEWWRARGIVKVDAGHGAAAKNRHGQVDSGEVFAPVA